MFSKELEKTVENVIEVILAAFLIVIAGSVLFHDPKNLGAWSFAIAGVLMIIKSNWEYNQRQKVTMEKE